MKRGENLVADLTALRGRANVDLATLAQVQQVINGHAGARMTIPAPTSHARRVAQARALLGAMHSGSKVANMQAVAAALGVHVATAYRLVAKTNNDLKEPTT